MTTTRRFTFDVMGEDDPKPQRGDLLTSARRVYLITEVRPVESRVWHDRWALTLRVLGPLHPWPREAVAEVLEEGARLIRSAAYRKGEGPADFARELGLPIRAG